MDVMAEDGKTTIIIYYNYIHQSTAYSSKWLDDI
jgi:hypothetical protein